MNYETFEKLNDAGFPFRKMDNPLGRFGPEYVVLAPRSLEEFSNFYEPTLEELIEACGLGHRCLACADLKCQFTSKGFKKLVYQNSGAGIHWDAVSVDQIIGCGKTPKEAVINLYLALKKKV